MCYQYKGYDAFCLSMSVCLNTGNFNTVCSREFHSPMHAASSKSNPHFFRLVLSCCHSNPASSIMVLLLQCMTCITLPVFLLSGFHLGTKKNWIHTLFHCEHNHTQTSNHFERHKAGEWPGEWPIFCTCVEVTWYHEWPHLLYYPTESSMCFSLSPKLLTIEVFHDPLYFSIITVVISSVSWGPLHCSELTWFMREKGHIF